jgi:hypothetical protein
LSQSAIPQPGALSSVPQSIAQKYADNIATARQAEGGPSGPCEDAKLSLLKQLDRTQADGSQGLIGQGPQAFDHEFVITKDGYVLDPVAQQAVDRGLTTWDELTGKGLATAVKQGIFTRQQWMIFSKLGGR